MTQLSILTLLWGFFGGIISPLVAQSNYYTKLISELDTVYQLQSGTWVLNPDEQGYFSDASAYGVSKDSLYTLTNQTFTKAKYLVVPTKGSFSYEAAHACLNRTAINQGDKVLYTFWVYAQTDTGKISIFIENKTTYEKEFFASVGVRPNRWYRFFVPFEAKKSYAIGTLNMGIQIGDKKQTLRVGGFAARNLGTAYTLKQLPLQLNQYYAGSESNASWRAAAAQRIEQNRKANINIAVQNQVNGSPVQSASVKVEMIQHDFKFGSAVDADKFAGNVNQNNTYEQKILNFDGLGHGFNEVVFENDLKWDGWEYHWNAPQADIADAAKWLNDRKISIRGHTLLWPGWNNMPSDMYQNRGNLPYMKNRIFGHLDEILTYDGLSEYVTDWDVLNEITLVEDLANHIKGQTGYPTGREIYKEVFDKVQQVSPQTKNYLNDYTTLDLGNTIGTPIYEKTKQYFKEIKEAGARVDGIGFQCHFDSQLASIYDVKNTLDDFANTFGTRAKITEFDFSSVVNDSIAGRFTKDFLTLLYSHPSVDGLLSWGFWDGKHWRNNAPFFNTDWTLKPAGKAVADLLFKTWWTNKTQSTPSSGQVPTIRGFKGKYKITITYKKQIKVIDTISVLSDFQKTYRITTSSTQNRVANGYSTYSLYSGRNWVQRGEAVNFEVEETPQMLQITTIDGRIIASFKPNSPYLNLTMPDRSGVYILTAWWQDGDKESIRVMVE